MRQLSIVVVVIVIVISGVACDRRRLSPVPTTTQATAATQPGDLALSSDAERDRVAAIEKKHGTKLAQLRSYDQHKTSVDVPQASAAEIFDEVDFKGLSQNALRHLLGAPARTGVDANSRQPFWEYGYDYGITAVITRFEFDPQGFVVAKKGIPTE